MAEINHFQSPVIFSHIKFMSFEIEKKFRLAADQFDQIPQKLIDLNATYLGEDSEENIIFGGGILSKDDSILRVRKIAGRTILTYKRRLESNFDVKHNVEYETEVENADAVENIILSIGFEPRIVYEKRRRSWKLGDVEVVLDELPFGLFMEIEGSMIGIKETELRLGADEFEFENETYPNLTARLGKKNGAVTESRF